MKPGRETAVEKFEKKGYNCCQAVVCTYSDRFGISEEKVFRLTEGFGLGMGGLMDTCGAVTGMFLTLSLANSAGDMENPLATKMDTYGKIREAAAEFKERKGSASVYCRDLKTENGKQPLPCCTSCVETAAAIMDEMLAKMQG